MPRNALNARLDDLYERWHHPEYLGSDPLVLVREAQPSDREVVAFLASCLALGRASLVVKAGRDLLQRIGTPITEALREGRDWNPALQGFGYRFFSASRMGGLLEALGRVLRDHGTLEAAWASTGKGGWEALDAFAGLFRSTADLGVLIPVPGSTGANKRLNLFLRWMVRCDALDPGGWTVLSPSQLFMPVDTHVIQWARSEGLTSRKVADGEACRQISRALAAIRPDDPLRYDFAITRQGMFQKGTLVPREIS